MLFRKKAKPPNDALRTSEGPVYSLIKEEPPPPPLKETEPPLSIERLFSSESEDDGAEEFVVVQIAGSEESDAPVLDELENVEDLTQNPLLTDPLPPSKSLSTSKKRKKAESATPKSKTSKRKKPRKTLISRRNRRSVGQVVPPSELGTPMWINMAPGKKAAALKTYIEVYGKRSLARKLRCITQTAQTAVDNLETELISLHGNATFLELGFKEDAALSTCNKRYQTAFNCLLKTLNHLTDKVSKDLLQFVQHDIALFCVLEDELDGFVREVGSQSNDVVRANPPPQPERMINLSCFNRYPSARSSGGRKRFGGSGSHISGSSTSTRRTASGGISSNASLGSGGAVQGRSATGNRGKKTTGLRPVMNEFVDYTCRLSS
jgi:hypothetical protein